jgi:3-oxoacyl-[acyl-carrier protein] reductase
VCVNYVARADAAGALVREITGFGGTAIAVQADVSDAGQAERLIEMAAADLGPVTVLVNNAGVAVQATLDTYDPAALDRMRRVNVDGMIHTTRAVMAGMRERRFGRIVNLSSIAALGTALAGNAFYAATKAEVAILTKRFAMELGPHGVTVNAVAPGLVRTEMSAASLRERGPDAERRLAGRAMVGRIGEPEDIAHAVAFLADPKSGWITAQLLVVDGGRMDYIGHG